MIILPNDFNKYVNKNIDKIILGLIEEGEMIMNDKEKKDKNDVRMIIEDIREWYIIRGNESTLDRKLDKRYFNLTVRYVDGVEI